MLSDVRIVDMDAHHYIGAGTTSSDTVSVNSAAAASEFSWCDCCWAVGECFGKVVYTGVTCCFFCLSEVGNTCGNFVG